MKVLTLPIKANGLEGNLLVYGLVLLNEEESKMNVSTERDAELEIRERECPKCSHTLLRGFRRLPLKGLGGNKDEIKQMMCKEIDDLFAALGTNGKPNQI